MIYLCPLLIVKESTQENLFKMEEKICQRYPKNTIIIPNDLLIETFLVHMVIGNSLPFVCPEAGFIRPGAFPLSFVSPGISQLEEVVTVDFKRVQNRISMALDNAHRGNIRITALRSTGAHQASFTDPVLHFTPEHTRYQPFLQVIISKVESLRSPVSEV